MLSVAVSRCVLYWLCRLLLSVAVSSQSTGVQEASNQAALAQQKCKVLLVAAALPSYREYWPTTAALKLQPRLSGMPSVLQAASLAELCGFTQWS